MRLQFLTSSSQRAWGAMFLRDLREDLFVFVYPGEAPRAFHTFFCAPLRIVALTANGTALFDQVIPPWKFVKLPACRYVIETHPKTDYRPYVNTIIFSFP